MRLAEQTVLSLGLCVPSLHVVHFLWCNIAPQTISYTNITIKGSDFTVPLGGVDQQLAWTEETEISKERPTGTTFVASLDIHRMSLFMEALLHLCL